MTTNPAEELVEIVDTDNRPIGALTRRLMREQGLIHRAAYILVFNTAGELFLQKRTFDVQKDHPDLLRQAMRHLARSGVLVFSNNYRKFKLDEALTREFNVREITDETIPPDFQRNRRIHRAWEFRHLEAQP